MNYFDVPLMVKPMFDKLSDDKKQHAYMMWQSQKKDPTTGLILSIFGLSLIYYGKVGMWILFLVTGGGGGIWWIIELINAKKRAEQINMEAMQKLLMQIA